MRSPDSAKAALFVLAIAMVVGFALLRRFAARTPVPAPVPPPADPGAARSGSLTTVPSQPAPPQP